MSEKWKFGSGFCNGFNGFQEEGRGKKEELTNLNKLAITS
jgi:hypothetical protein